MSTQHIVNERRQTQRVQARLRTRWEGTLAQCDGELVDLSAGGCFILTADRVKPKELIRIEIQLPTEGWIYLWGEVVYQVHEMGFALNFTGVSDTEHAMLELLLDYMRGETNATPAYAAAS